ncbi:hypothetical protein [Paenibacillus sinensis]|nr:hypothetical protein [Paenibacillus sinensis]
MVVQAAEQLGVVNRYEFDAAIEYLRFGMTLPYSGLVTGDME